jgi:hypothetical protein
MRSLRPTVLVSVLVLSLVSTRGLALEVEIDFDGSVLTIVDNDAVNDLNANLGTIDFDVEDTANRLLSARGRVFERRDDISHITELTAIPPDAAGVLSNASLLPANFTVTMRSSVYPVIGPPLAWTFWHQGQVAVVDPTLPDDLVEVTNHSASLFVDLETTPLHTFTVDNISDDGDPPIDLSDIFAGAPAQGSDTAADATTTQVVLALTLGPGDEFHAYPDPDEDGDSLFGEVFNQELRCIKKLNQQAFKAIKVASKVDVKCVKKAAQSDPEQCVEDPVAPKNEKIEDKIVLDRFPSFCAPPPAWGVNANSCCQDSTNEGAVCATNTDCSEDGTCSIGACISGAAVLASDGLAHDLFGDSVDVQPAARCSRGVHKLANKAVSTRWKKFFKCKKTNINLILTDTDLVALCLTGTQNSDPKVSKIEGKVAIAAATCAASLDTAFPGTCATAQDFDGCVVARTRCRFCQSVNVADDIEPAFGCDAFDNGAADSSCADYLP